jgi:non-canonical poly(A) RNA polymerase PAPD5/7
MDILKVDITFESTNELHLGVQCAELIKQQTKVFPLLEPLAVLIKKFLAIRDLNSPFKGGLSSYGLILLIVAMLKRNNFLRVSHAFFHFLKYYGKHFELNFDFIDEKM